MDILNSPRDVVIGLAVDESIRRLGLVSEAARPFLIDQVSKDSGIHPRALCTAHRKSGEQLSRAELKALGLRANAFMSRTALAEITDRGLEAPLAAHETTLLRAFFSYARWRSLWNNARGLEAVHIDTEAVSFQYDMLPPMCGCCAGLDGAKVAPRYAHILPPPECECTTANYSILMKIDWLHGIE